MMDILTWLMMAVIIVSLASLFIGCSGKMPAHTVNCSMETPDCNCSCETHISDYDGPLGGLRVW